MISQILIGLGIASLLIYFIVKKGKPISLNENVSLKKFKLFAILHFLMFLLSLSIYYNREDPYIRPFSYFLALSFMAIFVFCEIIYIPNLEQYRFLIITQIILISLSFVFTQAYMYATVLGRDPWIHSYLTSIIIEQGLIPDKINGVTSSYLKMPNFHLVIALFSIITNLSYTVSSIVAIGVSTLLIEIMLLYLIGKSLYDDKIGLLSALFVSISDNVLDMIGKSIIPNSIGVALVLFILWLSLTSTIRANICKQIIILIITFFVVATHPLAYMFLIIQSAILALGALFFRKYSCLQNIYTYPIITVVTGIFYWMWISENSFYQAVSIINAFNKYGASENLYLSKVTVPLSQILISRSSMIIYFAISLIGILWLANNEKKYSYVAMAGICGAMIGLGSSSFLAPALSGIAHRFWYYGEVVCGIPAAIAFALFYMNLNRRLAIFITGAMVGTLAILMLTASVANNDNPLAKSNSIRTGLYDSEIFAAKFVLSKNSYYSVSSDFDYLQNLLTLTHVQSADLSTKFGKTRDDILHYNSNLFILRTKMMSRLFVLGRTESRSTISLDKLVDELPDVKNILYNNGNVYIYF